MRWRKSKVGRDGRLTLAAFKRKEQVVRELWWEEAVIAADRQPDWDAARAGIEVLDADDIPDFQEYVDHTSSHDAAPPPGGKPVVTRSPRRRSR
jgi:hypothetical protein